MNVQYTQLDIRNKKPISLLDIEEPKITESREYL